MFLYSRGSSYKTLEWSPRLFDTLPDNLTNAILYLDYARTVQTTASSRGTTLLVSMPVKVVIKALEFSFKFCYCWH